MLKGGSKCFQMVFDDCRRFQVVVDIPGCVTMGAGRCFQIDFALDGFRRLKMRLDLC